MGNDEGKEKECGGSGDGGHEEQEAVTSSPEGDRIRGGEEAVGRSGQGCVYFLTTPNEQFMKIGYSVNVRARCQVLQKRSDSLFGTPARLIGFIPGTMATESWLHGKFSQYRYDGDWYRFAPAIRTFIHAVGLLPLKDSAMTEAAKAMGSRGGKARAKSLTKARRKEIASVAAKKRWKTRDEAAKGNKP
jgi:hypothetical protein